MKQKWQTNKCVRSTQKCKQEAIRIRENSFREKYDRYVSTNPTNPDLKLKALTAVAAKMARVACGMIKKNQPYRRFFEQSLPSGSIPCREAVGAPT